MKNKFLFLPGQSYPLSEIIKKLKIEINSGKISNVKEKIGYIELFENCKETEAIFKPFSIGWGASPFNPNCWRKINKDTLIILPQKKRKRKTFNKEERKKIYNRTKGYCYSCGEKLDLAADWWIEHIIPFSLGGSDELTNLLPSCKICNFHRSNFGPSFIKRMLKIGYAIIPQINKRTKLGKYIIEFLQKREAKLLRKRKNKENGK